MKSKCSGSPFCECIHCERAVHGLKPVVLSGKPCGEPGCLQHVTHPCEGCGRIAGKGDVVKDFDGKLGLVDVAREYNKSGKDGRAIEKIR